MSHLSPFPVEPDFLLFLFLPLLFDCLSCPVVSPCGPPANFFLSHPLNPRKELVPGFFNLWFSVFSSLPRSRVLVSLFSNELFLLISSFCSTTCTDLLPSAPLWEEGWRCFPFLESQKPPPHPPNPPQNPPPPTPPPPQTTPPPKHTNHPPPPHKTLVCPPPASPVFPVICIILTSHVSRGIFCLVHLPALLPFFVWVSERSFTNGLLKVQSCPREPFVAGLSALYEDALNTWVSLPLLRLTPPPSLSFFCGFALSHLLELEWTPCPPPLKLVVPSLFNHPSLSLLWEENPLPPLPTSLYLTPNALVFFSFSFPSVFRGSPRFTPSGSNPAPQSNNVLRSFFFPLPDLPHPFSFHSQPNPPFVL